MGSTTASEVAFGRTAPGICVRDIHVAHEFYARVLGFEKVFENGEPVGFMVLKKDWAEIHLSQKPDHRASTVNVMHMFVSDAAALYAICEAEGVRIVKGLTDKDYGQRAFVFADPDGNRIDIGERFPSLPPTVRCDELLPSANTREAVMGRFSPARDLP